MATQLTRIRQKAEQDGNMVFTSLYHHVYDVDNLLGCYEDTPAGKASGFDGETKESYGHNLRERLAKLSGALAQMSYVPPPTLRRYIPKAGSDKLRPLGISCFEAKLVERSLKQTLEQIYEPAFVDSSHGYRPQRRAHQAVDAVGRCIQQGKVNYVVEADIKGFFDHVNHEWLLKFLRHRVGDERVLRMIERFLKAGIMEEGLVRASEEGTPQGSVLSPLLSNVYLHYALDLWFQVRVRKACYGEAYYFRYADDFLACFQFKDEAERFLKEVGERLGQFHLELEPSKTRLLAFGRFTAANAAKEGGKPQTFDFLGFTFYCGATRRGTFKVKRKTAAKKFRHKLKEAKEWLKKVRSRVRLPEIMATARRKLEGHLNYYGITDNLPECASYRTGFISILFKWLNRRSQRKSYTWEQFNQMLKTYGKLPEVSRKVDLCPFRKASLS
ncbi:MAG: group II intron reverse transcriptase/maturase [Verrucomicrobia bacterium]|nr:group II intron reverse transcriptase/maturase [Verrucomicrobiota bacterium]